LEGEKILQLLKNEDGGKEGRWELEAGRFEWEAARRKKRRPHINRSGL